MGRINSEKVQPRVDIAEKRQTSQISPDCQIGSWSLTAKRPAEELFDIHADPGCLNNLASDPKFEAVKNQLASQLTEYLTKTGDLRQTDPEMAGVWETYPRYSPLRWFPKPDWASESPPIELPWLEARRPRE